MPEAGEGDVHKTQAIAQKSRRLAQGVYEGG